MTFTIDDDELPKLNAWMAEQRKKMLARGGGKIPYTGAIGGCYTYSFTDTSIGQIVNCKNGITGDSIDLSGML